MKKQLLVALVTGLSIMVSASSVFSKEKIAVSNIKNAVIIIAEKHNVPASFALALVEHESRFDPNVRGSHGEYGLGQIKCSTARSVGFKGNCSLLLGVDTNLEYSMRYLREALNKADDNICHAATLYNRGLDNRPRSSKYCKSVLASL